MKMKTVIMLCAISFMAVTGCGEKTDQAVTVVDVKNADLDKTPGAADSSNGGIADGTDGVDEEESIPESEGSEGTENKKEPSENGNTLKENREELEGTVRSIGDASIVISKIFTEGTEEEGVLLAAEPSEGSEDEVLITVNFCENTAYMLHTVKNGGVNADSDVTKTEASFSDLKEGESLLLSGHFTTPDKEYVADSVIIYNFI